MRIINVCGNLPTVPRIVSNSRLCRMLYLVCSLYNMLFYSRVWVCTTTFVVWCTLCILYYVNFICFGPCIPFFCDCGSLSLLIWNFFFPIFPNRCIHFETFRCCCRRHVHGNVTLCTNRLTCIFNQSFTRYTILPPRPPVPLATPCVRALRILLISMSIVHIIVIDITDCKISLPCIFSMKIVHYSGVYLCLCFVSLVIASKFSFQK